MEIILATESPRKIKVMETLGLPFKTIPANYPEETIKETNPLKLVETLALEKARTLASKYPKALVIGADTVMLVDGNITGKPKDLADARATILNSSGKIIEDATGVAVIYKDQERSASMIGKVTLRKYTEKEVDDYIKETNPLDKAGGFAADPAEGGRFLAGYEGEPGQELGLPKTTLIKFLKEFSVEVP